MRSERALPACIVGGLVVGSAIVTLATSSGSVWRELGLAVLSGAVVGGVLVLVEEVLRGAAEAREARTALLLQLTSTIDLNAITLRGRDLHDIYLPGRALMAAQLIGANLHGATLLFGDLRFADLTDADLSGADLRGSTLAGADLRRANLSGALLDDADLSGADLDGADLRDLDLIDVRMEGTKFGQAYVDGLRIGNGHCTGADLGRVHGQISFVGPIEYDASTTWGPGCAPPASSVVHQEPISTMDLPAYLAYKATARPR